MSSLYLDFLHHPHVEATGAVTWLEQPEMGKGPLPRVPGPPRRDRESRARWRRDWTSTGPRSWASSTSTPARSGDVDLSDANRARPLGGPGPGPGGDQISRLMAQRVEAGYG